MKKVAMYMSVWIALVAGALLDASPAYAADAPATAQANFDRLIESVHADDRKMMVQGATDEMRDSLTSAGVHRVSREFGPHLEKGFQGTYLCELKQKGLVVQLWKVSFTDGRDDAVVRVAMQGEQVAGFFIQ